MPENHAVIVQDAHLSGNPEDESVVRFHRFIHSVRDFGAHLIINGDLFEFWFEYRRAIPKHAYVTLSKLSRLVEEGTRLTIIGGNHDRWTRTRRQNFWKEQIGADFFRKETVLDIAGMKTLVCHGDGFKEPDFSARITHRIIGHPLTEKIFGLVHPDLGIPLVNGFSALLSKKKKHEASAQQRAADTQETLALELLEKRTDLDLAVFGHTHVPKLIAKGKNRWYMNPGAWVDDFRFATISPDGPQLRRFEE